MTDHDVTLRRRRPSAALVAVAAALVAAATLGSASRATAGTAPADTGVSPRTEAAEARVADLLPGRISDRRIGDTVGVAVIDAESGRPIVDEGGNRRMLPASNMKILTATAVLTSLGPKHRFTTSVVRVPGAAEVTLVGGGDPLLGSDDLRELARRTAAAYRSSPPALAPAAAPAAGPAVEPAARPAVTVRIDDDLFPKPTRGPGWTSSYMPYSAAPVRPLARLGDYSWDTAQNAARVFVSALRSNGLRAKLAGRADSPPGAEVVADVRDHTVADAVRVMLQVSENNVAEALFRHVGLTAAGDASWHGASTGVHAVLMGLGIDTSRLRISDGSGLSRTDRLTPNALAAVTALSTHPDLPQLAPIYADRGLPTAGMTGTLASAYGRYTTQPSRCARGKVFAKTGSLFDTIALSGIAMGEDGKPKAFSFLVNDRPQAVAMLSTRQALDGLAATVTGCW